MGSLLITATVLAADPATFIPERSSQVVRLNVNRITQLPWMINLLQTVDDKCREFASLLDELKKSDIQPATFFAGDLWSAKIGNDDKSFVILIKTTLPESRFAEFFNAQKKHNKKVDLSVSTLAGKTVYSIKYAPAYKAAGEVPVVVTYLAADVIALMPLNEARSILTAAMQTGNGNNLVKDIDRKKLCAILVNAVNRKKKVRSINAWIDLTGSEQRDIVFNAAISFKNAKTAMRKAFEMQFIVPSFAGLLFGNDQKLMEEITSPLQIVPNQEKVMLKFILTQSVQEKIAAYFANPANVPALNINPADLSNME